MDKMTQVWQYYYNIDIKNVKMELTKSEMNFMGNFELSELNL